MDLASLGIEKEQIIGLVVDKLVTWFLRGDGGEEDEDGYRSTIESRIMKEIQADFETRINEAVEKAVDTIANNHITERIEALIETTQFQPTTNYGEKKGPALSFRELLTSKATAYLNEQVNEQGETQKVDSYRWRAEATRASFLMGKKIHEIIAKEMNGALINANQAIAQGIEAAVKIQLETIRQKLSIQVMQQR